MLKKYIKKYIEKNVKNNLYLYEKYISSEY